MELKDGKSKWIKFLFQRGQVWTLEEAIYNDPPDYTDGHGIVRIIVHDDKRTGIAYVELMRIGHTYYSSTCLDDVSPSSYGRFGSPGPTPYDKGSKNKFTAILDAIQRMIDDRNEIYKEVRESFRKAYDFLSPYESKKMTPVQLEIEW